jgi:protease II
MFIFGTLQYMYLIQLGRLTQEPTKKLLILQILVSISMSYSLDKLKPKTKTKTKNQKTKIFLTSVNENSTTFLYTYRGGQENRRVKKVFFFKVYNKVKKKKLVFSFSLSNE